MTKKSKAGNLSVDKKAIADCVARGRDKELCEKEAWASVVKTVQSELDSVKSIDHVNKAGKHSQASAIKSYEAKLKAAKKKSAKKGSKLEKLENKRLKAARKRGIDV